MTRYTCTCTIYTGLYTGLTYTTGICTWDKHARSVNFTGQTASTVLTTSTQCDPIRHNSIHSVTMVTETRTTCIPISMRIKFSVFPLSLHTWWLYSLVFVPFFCRNARLCLGADGISILGGLGELVDCVCLQAKGINLIRLISSQTCKNLMV